MLARRRALHGRGTLYVMYVLTAVVWSHSFVVSSDEKVVQNQAYVTPSGRLPGKKTEVVKLFRKNIKGLNGHGKLHLKRSCSQGLLVTQRVLTRVTHPEFRIP